MSVRTGTAYVDVKPNMEGFSNSVATGTKSVASKLGAAMKAVIGAAIVRKVVQMGLDFAHMAEDAAAMNRKSFSVIKSDTDGALINFAAMKDWATSFGNSIGQDDEAITTLASKIATSFNLVKLFGNDAQAGLQKLTAGIINMSAVTGKSQTMVTKLFQSMANDPKAAITSLVKLNVITKRYGEHLAHLVDNGHAATVSQKLLTLATDKYADGARKGATETEKFNARMDNLKETIGEKLQPVLKWLHRFILDLANIYIPDLITRLEDFGGDMYDFGVKVFNFMAGLGKTLGNWFIEAINIIISGANRAIDAIAFLNPFGGAGISRITPLQPVGLPPVPKTAAGGIVTRPQVRLIGEAGPEAVIPLSRAGAMHFIIDDWRNGLGHLEGEQDWMARG